MAEKRINPIDIPDEKTTFSPREWKYFIEEVKLRGIEKFEQCINNARYLAMLDHSAASEYKVVVSMDELEAMARDE